MAARSARKPAAQPPAKTPEERALEFFTSPLVDLDVFSQGVTTYTVTTVTGEARSYEIPNDPPFPAVLAFLRSKDDFYRVQLELAKAPDRKRQALEETSSKAWEQMLTGFLGLIQFRTPEATLADLNSIGEGVMANWIGQVETRVQLRRLSPDIATFLGQLLAGGVAGDPKEITPPSKPLGSPARSRSSRSSAS